MKAEDAKGNPLKLHWCKARTCLHNDDADDLSCYVRRPLLDRLEADAFVDPATKRIVFVPRRK
jgi:hypothetical protein